MNRRIPVDPSRQTGREPSARSLMNLMLSGATEARDWSQAIELPQEAERSVEEMISQSGGVSQLARHLGVSRSTVQRWQSGHSTPKKSSQAKLAAYNQQINRTDRADVMQRELGELVNRYGGTKQLAGQLGVHESTVRRWMSGQVKQLSPQAQTKLAAADRQYRFRATFNINIDTNGVPDTQVFMQAKGSVNVITRGSPPYAVAGKNIGSGTPGYPGHLIDPDTVSGLYTAATDGDPFAALDALQGHLSTSYAKVPEGYDPEGFGLHFDDIEQFELFQ